MAWPASPAHGSTILSYLKSSRAENRAEPLSQALQFAEEQVRAREVSFRLTYRLVRRFSCGQMYCDFMSKCIIAQIPGSDQDGLFGSEVRVKTLYAEVLCAGTPSINLGSFEAPQLVLVVECGPLAVKSALELAVAT
ncbi:hypothetical protein HJFPF1_04532 [Paramyrothecium foliicola]|nr:hypothetical protein HJFPF1_04532 [Paramyrothecium foliicola]